MWTTIGTLLREKCHSIVYLSIEIVCNAVFVSQVHFSKYHRIKVVIDDRALQLVNIWISIGVKLQTQCAQNRKNGST